MVVSECIYTICQIEERESFLLSAIQVAHAAGSPMRIVMPVSVILYVRFCSVFCASYDVKPVTHSARAPEFIDGTYLFRAYSCTMSPHLQSVNHLINYFTR